MKKIIILVSLCLFVLTSCGQKNNADIINPNAVFLYFYGWSCPHCQELNEEMDEQDIYSQVPIEKREVYANNQNREIFLETVQNLGLTERDMSVPFVLDKRSNTYVVGTQPAMDMFEEYINQQQNPEPIIDVTNSGTTVEVVENIGNALEVEVIDTSTPSTQSE